MQEICFQYFLPFYKRVRKGLPFVPIKTMMLNEFKGAVSRWLLPCAGFPVF